MEVNMKDIARHAGVSVSTVSRVLNGQGYIRQETREKVLRAIEKYHYIPNNSARNLKREAVKAVGIVVKGFSNPFFVRMLDVVQRVLEEKGYLMYLHPIDPLEDEVEEAVSLVKEKKPMGILFLGGNFEHGRGKAGSAERSLCDAGHDDEPGPGGGQPVFQRFHRRLPGDLRGGASGMACRAPQSCGDGVP